MNIKIKLIILFLLFNISVVLSTYANEKATDSLFDAIYYDYIDDLDGNETIKKIENALRKGANINEYRSGFVRGPILYTPIHIAIISGLKLMKQKNIIIIKYLINKGADINKKSKCIEYQEDKYSLCDTPLHTFVNYSKKTDISVEQKKVCIDILYLLLNNKADPYKKNKNGETVIDCAQYSIFNGKKIRINNYVTRILEKYKK